MEKFNFTDASIRKLTIPLEREEYGDDGLPGLLLRVTPKGEKTFCVRRRVSGGSPVRVTIGKFGAPWNVADARAKAKKIMAELADSNNPTEAKRRLKDELTLDELFKLYIADRVKAGKRSINDMKAQYERYLGKMPDTPPKKHGRKREKPEGGVDWSKKRLSEITPATIETLHTRLVSLGKATTANRVHELLRAIFGFADSKKLVSENPAANVTPAPEKERHRFIQDAELKAFYSSLDAEVQPWSDYIKVLLFVGYRRAAVASMRWDDVNLDAGIWYVRGEKAKNGEPIVLPLAGVALEVLTRRNQERSQGAEWVFPGDGKDGHITSPEKAWERVCLRAGIKDLRLHDLRHTLASWMINNGVNNLSAIGRVLGHKDPRSTQRYAHLITETAAAAVGAAHTAMQAAIDNDKVIPFHKKSA